MNAVAGIDDDRKRQVRPTFLTYSNIPTSRNHGHSSSTGTHRPAVLVNHVFRFTLTLNSTLLEPNHFVAQHLYRG